MEVIELRQAEEAVRLFSKLVVYPAFRRVKETRRQIKTLKEGMRPSLMGPMKRAQISRLERRLKSEVKELAVALRALSKMKSLHFDEASRIVAKSSAVGGEIAELHQLLDTLTS